jgi:hypothetical protein
MQQQGDGPMSEEMLPSIEEFIPIDVRPACPICGYDMIHTRIELEDEKGQYAFHVWICSCENPEEEMAREIVEARYGISAESLIITIS